MLLHAHGRSASLGEFFQRRHSGLVRCCGIEMVNVSCWQTNDDFRTRPRRSLASSRLEREVREHVKVIEEEKHE